MDFLKKWLGCIISFIAGVCGLALSACSGMKVLAEIDASAINSSLSKTSSEIVKAFKVITDADLYTQAKDLGITTEFVWLKVFAIITLVVSVALIVWSIVLLLKNVNVIKVSNNSFNIVTFVLITLLVVATLGLLISSNVYASELETALISATKLQYIAGGVPEVALSSIIFDINAKVGVYQPTIFVISVIAFIINGIFTFINKKTA